MSIPDRIAAVLRRRKEAKKLAERKFKGIGTAEARGEAEKAAQRRAERQKALSRWQALGKRLTKLRKRLSRLTPTKISSKCAAFIEDFEGAYPYAYNDPVGYATAWIGHLLHFSAVSSADKAKWGDEANKATWASEKQMRAQLKSDMAQYVKAVLDQFDVDLTQQQLDGFASFAMNCGPGALATSAERVNRGESICGVAGQELPKWVHGGGVVLPGLVRRRNAEVRVICNANYSTA